MPGMRGFAPNSIGNKMVAVLIAVAVLPAVTVALYALRKTSDSLSEQALSLISEACVTDARRVEDELSAVERSLASLAKDNAALRFLFASLAPRNEAGEVQVPGDEGWERVRADLDAVDQKLRSLFDQQRSCRTALVRSLDFNEEHGRSVLRLDRSRDGVTATILVEKGPYNLPREVASDPDPLLEQVLKEWNAANEEHPERDLLRATVLDAVDGDALEVFAAKVRGVQGRELGWVFLVHSFRELLREVRAGAGDDPGVATLFRAGRQLATIATSIPGRFVVIPDRFDLPQQARNAQSTAALIEGQIVAFAPLTPRADDPSELYVLAVERPARELLASVQRFRQVFSGVLAAALLLAAGIGIAFARRLTRPLQVLRDGAIQVGRGDLTQTLDVRTGDEAEELAREFNAMASQLRSLYAGMESTIRERTEQLQSTLDELRRAHDQIVESEKRYSDIVENASDLIQVTDAEHRFVSSNRRQAQLFGVSVDELRGKPFLERVAPDVRDATRRGFEHVLAGGTLQAFASTLLVDGTRTLPVEISATPVLEQERPVGVRAILRDVSERKAMEGRLIKAERLSSIGALAAGVAHEINNPMGIITMFAQRTLERARKGEIDVAKLEKIVEQGKRVAGITRNLLDFARAAPTRFAPFAMADVVRATCGLVADRARLAGIALVEDVAADLPPVFGNSQQISQVLLNLFLNAFQAIGRDGRVVVRAVAAPTSRLPTTGRAVRVSVEDDGPGIPADVLPRLFEPFFTTKAPGEGTGLGLSVSYGILKEHHGAIFAENRAEGGARFEFELPLDVGAASTGETKSPIAARRD